MALSSVAGGGHVRNRPVASATEQLRELALSKQWQQAAAGLFQQQLQQHPRSAQQLSCNVFLSSCSQNWRLVLQLLAAVRLSSWQPDIVGHNTLAAACSRARQWPIALEVVLQVAPARGLGPDKATGNVALAACAGAALWAAALQLLFRSTSQRARVPLDVVSLNTAVTACERGSAWPAALLLAGRELRQLGLSPDICTLSAVISACSRSCFQEAEGVVADEACCNAAATACERAGQLLRSELRRASGGVEEGGAAGPSAPPGAGAFGAAAGACGQAGAAELLSSALQAGVRPDLGLCTSAAMGVATGCVEPSDAIGGFWANALHWLLKDSGVRFGLRLDMVAFGASVSVCEKARVWDMALHLLWEGRARGLRSTIYGHSHNAAISACEKGRRWERALGLLLDLVPRSDARRAEGLVQPQFQSGWDGLSPDVVSWNAAVSACEKGCQWGLALRLLGEARRSGLAPGRTAICSATLASCSQGGRWELLLQSLQALSAAGISPDATSFSAAVAACGDQGLWSRAVDLLGQARGGRRSRSEQNDNNNNYNNNNYNKNNNNHNNNSHSNWNDGNETTGAWSGLRPDATALCAAAYACAKGLRWPLALDLLSLAQTAGDNNNNKSNDNDNNDNHNNNNNDNDNNNNHNNHNNNKDNSRSHLGSELRCLAVAGLWDRALALFRAALRSGPEPYGAILGACVSALAASSTTGDFLSAASAAAPQVAVLPSSGQWHWALLLLADGRARSLELSAVAFGASVSACERAGRWEQAMLLLPRMRLQRVLLDAPTCGAAISACQRGLQWAQGQELLDALRRTGTGEGVLEGSANSADSAANAITYNSAISACAKGSQWVRAFELVAAMHGSDVAPDVVSFNAALSACDNAHRWEHSFSLLEAMRSLRLALDAVSCNTAVSACEKAGEWRWALRLLRSGISAPDLITYSAALGLRAGRPLGRRPGSPGGDEMLGAALRPGAVALGAALGACQRVGRGLGALPDLFRELRCDTWAVLLGGRAGGVELARQPQEAPRGVSRVVLAVVACELFAQICQSWFQRLGSA
ncbi:unnamed protein product [Polarella glacialis]|uniref:Pentatricopeptide repeat-containing protein, chloroplastic n=1 Tax=Polarella glacialis TaxID=89957 RepID=A0A813GTW4_POLGL|nr:unnamed protein product [Polarella glacialis]